jgi:hypothetical protein
VDELRVLDALFRDQLELQRSEPRAENGDLAKMGVRTVLSNRSVANTVFRKCRLRLAREDQRTVGMLRYGLEVLDALFRDQLDLQKSENGRENGGLRNGGVRAVFVDSFSRKMCRSPHSSKLKGGAR